MFKFPRTESTSSADGSALGRKLQFRTERLGELSPAELGRVVAAIEPKNKCTCTTDVSNSCCGPNGSC